MFINQVGLSFDQEEIVPFSQHGVTRNSYGAPTWLISLDQLRNELINIDNYLKINCVDK